MARTSLRDISLTALLAVQVYFLFFLQPAAAIGFDLPFDEVIFAAVVLLVILVSPSRVAAAVTALSLLSASAAIIMHRRLPSPVTDCLAAAAALGALVSASWVVARSVYSPGPITAHRLRGAIILYFNVALAFGVVFRLVYALAPDSFRGIDADETADQLAADLLYFSVITLSTDGLWRHRSAASYRAQHGEPGGNRRSTLHRHGAGSPHHAAADRQVTRGWPLRISGARRRGRGAHPRSLPHALCRGFSRRGPRRAAGRVPVHAHRQW